MISKLQLAMDDFECSFSVAVCSICVSGALFAIGVLDSSLQPDKPAMAKNQKGWKKYVADALKYLFVFIKFILIFVN